MQLIKLFCPTLTAAVSSIVRVTRTLVSIPSALAPVSFRSTALDYSFNLWELDGPTKVSMTLSALLIQMEIYGSILPFFTHFRSALLPISASSAPARERRR
jgi:hypothetical protein